MHGNTQAWLLTFETWTVCHLSGLGWFKADIQLVDPGQHDASILAQACQFGQACNSQGSAGVAEARCPKGGKHGREHGDKCSFVCT